MKKLVSLLFLSASFSALSAFAQTAAPGQYTATKTTLGETRAGLVCTSGGFRCSVARLALETPQRDEVVGNISIVLDGNTIRVTNTGQKNAVTKEMFAKFSMKTIVAKDNEFDAALAASLFRSANLPTPPKIVFKAAEQTYVISNGNITFTDRTKITLGGKEYNLVVVTTTGTVSLTQGR